MINGMEVSSLRNIYKKDWTFKEENISYGKLM